MSHDARGISPRLLDFAGCLLQSGHPIFNLRPEHAAAAFRDHFNLPVPVTVDAMCSLLIHLGYENTKLKPHMEHMCDVRGSWNTFNDLMSILIDAERPAGSRTKTVLHEIIEPVWQTYMEIFAQKVILKEREAWCNRFAAMVKMPPDVFAAKASDCGMDVRVLAQQFDETLAGVSRQLRDVVFPGKLFYFCRFDVMRGYPRRAPASFLRALEESGGFVVRMVDVVKSRGVKLGEDYRSAFPGYNLPGRFQYRIVHPSLRRYIDGKRPVLVPSFRGDLGNGGQGDLFGDNELCVLMYNYGYKKNPGFFMLVTRASDRPLLERQLEASRVETRYDIDWVFSLECLKPRQKARLRLEPGLTATRDDGSGYDLSLEPFLWPGLRGMSTIQSGGGASSERPAA